ncbi:MAG: AAA family ATPase [Candidatus Dadabacteria bacterium]|nr:AAA family ATPase [Candidatus Dadabacteria bacterium]
MSTSVHKINSIKNMAIFRDFDWTRSAITDGDSVAVFKKINILYGRNYSGKTTLSRIFRAIETGRISEKFDNPSFNVEFKDGTEITRDTLQNHRKKIRVFNEDFVRDNLYFVSDPDDGIEPFAILGEDNNKIQREIRELESELGSNDEGNETGLRAECKTAASALARSKQDLEGAKKSLEEDLKRKAIDRTSGIKYRFQRFGDQNYNFNKIKSDIEKVRQQSYEKPSDEQYSQAERSISEEALEPTPPFRAPTLHASELADDVEALAIRKINDSNKIEEFLDDIALNQWAKKGRDLHKGKRENCAFCGSLIAARRWAELEKHFNEEADQVEKEIDALIEKIEKEKSDTSSALKVDKNNFYSKFHERLEKLDGTLQGSLQRYVDFLDVLNDTLSERKAQIFRPVSFARPHDPSSGLYQAWNRYEEIRRQSDEYSNSIADDQKRARELLRLKEVSDYLFAIGYENKINSIRQLEERHDKAEREMHRLQSCLDEKLAEVAGKKLQLNDEEKGARLVNEYLNNSLGHHFLSLEARKQEAQGEDSAQIRFEVIRDGKKAYHLSEGERSLLAFCYFLAKLQDVDTMDSRPIIWIDDPISSLDANHIFFVFSLMEAVIVAKEKFEQLFVSTHNLNFLKYLKRLKLKHLDDNGKSYEKGYFSVIRKGDSSTIERMPKYLKEYVTEFNYLFRQIHECAKSEVVDDSSYTTFYGFANDARKFLEIYLYYKYPDRGMNIETLSLFFGEERIPAVLTDRINNEYSHLSGVFERGSMPIEVPELHAAAKQIIERLKEDKDQYFSLLKSIGLYDEPG